MVTKTSRVRPTVKEEIMVSGQGRRQSYDIGLGFCQRFRDVIRTRL